MSKEKTRILIYDRASIESSNRSIDENGYMHVEISNVTKEQVAPYYGEEIPNFKQLGFEPDKLYHGYRPASELAKEETIKSLNGIPILLEHHPDSAQEPAKEYRVGATGTDARFKAPYLQNSLHIQDADAINRIKDGSMQELSLGYFYTPMRKEGEFNGEKYDFVMTDIACNHVALVEKGRAGSDVRVEDSALNTHLPSQLTGEGKEDLNLQAGLGASMEEKENLLDEFLKELADAGIDTEKAKAKLAEIYGDKAEDEEAEAEEPKEVEDLGAESEDDGEEVEAETEENADDEEIDSDADSDVKAEDEEEENEADAFDAGDVLKSCGLDAEDPVVQTAFKKGFAEGTKYGEKLEKKEPAKLDSEHESEGEKRALGEDSVRRLVKAVEDKFNAKFNAIEETKSSLGKVRASAFDSAEDVYLSALKAEGVNVKGFKKSEARTAYRALVAGKAKAVRTTASDSIKKVSKSNTSNILAGVRMGEF